MSSLKNCLIIVFSLFITSSVQCADLPAGQAPPFEIRTGDTSSFTFSGRESIVHESPQSQTAIVEDTILPPCDILFFKSGKLEYCKIIETTPTTITYKMCDYQDGPNIVVNKSDIHKIRYANGKEEVVTADKPTVNAYVKARKDPLATLSLIFGLTGAGIIILFGYIFPALALAGLVLGIISFFKIRRRKGELRGKGAAIIGIVLSLLILILLASL